MDHQQPGLFLRVNPLRFDAIFQLAEGLGRMTYELTAEQAATLGATLLRLSGAEDALSIARDEQRGDQEFLTAARIATA